MTSKKWLGVLLYITIPLQFNSCGVDIENPIPPSSPVWIDKSLPLEWPERGVDAHESGGIFLQWYPVIGEDIGKYYLHRAEWFESRDSLGEFEIVTMVPENSASVLEYTDESAIKRVRYYYKLKSENNSGMQSEFSESVSYKLITRVGTAGMKPNGLTDTLSQERTLSWNYDLDIAMEDYVITLLSDESDLLYRNLLQPGNYTGSRETWDIPSNINLISGNIYLWRIDTGANYEDGRETTGSESAWATFYYEDI